MNLHASFTDLSNVNMTSKGQVLVPKAIRDRIGFVPGGPVQVGVNDRGEVVILPVVATRVESVEERRRRIRAAIDDLAGRYSTGQSTDDYMAEIRGPYDDLL